MPFLRYLSLAKLNPFWGENTGLIEPQKSFYRKSKLTFVNLSDERVTVTLTGGISPIVPDFHSVILCPMRSFTFFGKAGMAVDHAAHCVT